MSLTVQCLRNGHLETLHPVSAALVDGGLVRWSVGPDLATYWRSASKPFQLANSLDHLPTAQVVVLSDRELAVGAASHSGQPEHTELVAGLLHRFGLSPEQLQCGAHSPMHERTARDVGKPGVLHNNCSGKHTFMLAASVARGWDPDYRPLAHPLQTRNHQALDEWAGVHHLTGVDGCSIPTFHAPLSAQARAWSRLAEQMAEIAALGGGSIAGRIGWAMHREPFYMSGAERLDLAVVQQAAEPVTVKIGAEGLFCVALPERRAGLAVKVHTGNSDVLAVALKAVLAKLGVTLTGEWNWDTVRNVRKAVVGERVAVWG